LRAGHGNNQWQTSNQLGSAPIKNVVNACDAGDKDAAIAAYKDAVPVIDSMINKGIVNKNKAARHKSRLNKRIKALAA
jgi:small subunit ribosomal protein S20